MSEWPKGSVINVRAISAGALVPKDQPRSTCGRAQFFENDIRFFIGSGCGGGARGVNVAIIDMSTGKVEGIRSFDISLAEQDKMVTYLDRQSVGTLILLAVADTGPVGGVSFSGAGPYCEKAPTFERSHRALEALGSTLIRQYCWQDSWSMIAIKGRGKMDEQLAASRPPLGSTPMEVTSSYSFTVR